MNGAGANPLPDPLRFASPSLGINPGTRPHPHSAYVPQTNSQRPPHPSALIPPVLPRATPPRFPQIYSQLYSPGTSRTEPILGCGTRWISAVCWLRGVKLQPAPDRKGVAGASADAIQNGASLGLKPPNCEPPDKADRSGVASAGDFLTLSPLRPVKPAARRFAAVLSIRTTSKNTRFRPDTR